MILTCRNFFDDYLNEVKDLFFQENKLNFCSIGSHFPFCDIYETKDSLEFEFAVAGFCKDEVTVEVKHGNLIVSGCKKPSTENKKGCYIFSSIKKSDFERAFSLPDFLDCENPEVFLKDGILKIIFKVQKEKQSKKIEIK